MLLVLLLKKLLVLFWSCDILLTISGIRRKTTKTTKLDGRTRRDVAKGPVA